MTASKFRIGDYRLICSKENEELTIIVIELGHRNGVYK
jgi:mRNA-degrading endonuclease RelE of RelBE toxin-antitoxin system